MYVVLAVFLLLHGVAHLVGFAGPWGLSSRIAPQTALLDGRLAIGPGGMRAVGVFWLITGAAFAVAAAGALRHNTWWPSLTLTVAVVSLILSIFGLPEAKLGIAINVFIIAGLLLAQLSGSTFGRA